MADIASLALTGWEKFSRRQKLLLGGGASAFILALTALASHEPGTALSPDFFVTLAENPSQLSEEDVALYKAGFAAVTRGDEDTVLATLRNVANPRLGGQLLARLYLRSDYTTSPEKLTEWLAKYQDHPQAAQLSRLAIARGVRIAAIPVELPLKGDGYAEHLGRSTMPDGWYRALSLWREKNYGAAEPLFAAVGDNQTLTSWQRAAGYYWAARAAKTHGDNSTAHDRLKAAAGFNTTFYGLLAVQQIGGSMAEARAPRVSGALRNDPRAVRAALFARLDFNDEAEAELRHLYSAADKKDRGGIITLAHELNLPNLQVRLANLSQLSPEEELFASYPMPQFVIDAQTEQSPALLLAIARNESGFRETASSGAGAVGLMQMLPSTANSVERRVGRDTLQVASNTDLLEPIAARLNDPATSVRYSAQYLKILSQEPAIGKNLVRVLAAYNAGPGTVSGWQSMARVDDPLLYIESIPYAETRNYVMQVMSQYWIYAGLLGETPASLRAVAADRWPGFGA